MRILKMILGLTGWNTDDELFQYNMASFPNYVTEAYRPESK